MNEALFVKYQPNSHKGGDCVVRTLTKAENKSWYDIYDALCRYGRTLQRMPNEKETYEMYLKDKGYKKIPIKPTRGERRGTVYEWAKGHPKGTYVLAVANHLVCVQDGKYYDTWDCGDRSLYGVFEK